MPPVVKLARVCRDLNSAAGWLKELSSIYRSARRGQLDSSEASRLAYIASVASKLARDLEELRHVETLQRQLAELRGTQPNALQWSPPPADDHDEANRVIEGAALNGGGP